MALTAVAIANMALSNIGARHTIAALTEDNEEADACELWYDQARLETLEAYDWGFARRRAALVAHADDPPDNVWAYRYVYPSDCVKALYLENPLFVHHSIIRDTPFALVQGDAIPFSIEMDDAADSKSLLTDLDDATLVYTFDQDEPSMFTRTFALALSYQLASHIAFVITGKQSLEERMAFKARLVIQNAAANDLNEGIRHPPRESEFIRARW